MGFLPGTVALALSALTLATAAGALPLDLADPTDREVLVRFEVSDVFIEADLQTPHEGFGESIRLSLTFTGSRASIGIPASVVEAQLLTPGPFQSGEFIAGSATDGLLEIDVATAAVSLQYSFDATAMLGQLGPFRIAVNLRSDRAGGFLPSFRYCEAPPRCIFVPGEAYDPSTGLLLAIGPGTAEGAGSALFVLDAELSEVPEPGTGLLLLAGLLGFARSARRRRVAIVAAASALGVACGAPIAIVSPAPGTVLMAPDADVALAFDPPLAPGETVTATLQRGLDAPSGPEPPDDVAGALAIAPDTASATLALADLLPGRNDLVVERLAAGGLSLGSRTLTLDRGGFPGAEGGPFGAGARYERLTRTTARGATRIQEIAVWYPTADPAAQPATPIELELRALLEAPLAPGTRRLPLILYSHGNCGWEGEVGYLASDFARAGYAVAATSHPGNTSIEIDPPCTEDPTSDAERSRDVRAMLDALLTWNADPAWPLAGAIDPSRIGVAGFSAGGATAWLLSGSEPRIHAALHLANSFAFPVAKPTMFLAGTLDASVPPDEIQAIFDVSFPPRFFVAIEGANHRSFANDCLEPFFDCVSGILDRDAGHALIRRYARGFLHRYVADDVRGEALLVSVPGAELQEER